MASIGDRFDIDSAREEARLARVAAKRKALLSNLVMVAVVLAVIGGAKFGWDKYQENKEREAELQAEREAQEAARERQRKLQEEQLRKEREEKRRQEVAAKEAERLRQQKEREAERLRKQAEDLRLRQEAEAARQREIAEREEQRECRARCENAVKGLKFQIDEHIVYGYGLSSRVENHVDGERWLALSNAKSRALEFFELLRDASITNDFSLGTYPDAEVMSRLMDNLDKSSFTLVMMIKDAPDGSATAPFGIYEFNPDVGFEVPASIGEISSGKRMLGWTAPFVYGEGVRYYVMSNRAAEDFSRDWLKMRRKLRRDAKLLDNAAEWYAAQLKVATANFLTGVKIELAQPPPPAADEKSEREKAREKAVRRPKATLRGPTDTRSIGRPVNR